MLSIEDFVKSYCGEPAKSAFEPPATFEDCVKMIWEFEKQRALAQSSIASSLKYVNKQEVCPKCDGEGIVQNIPGLSSSTIRTCPVCMGAKVVVNSYHY